MLDRPRISDLINSFELENELSGVTKIFEKMFQKLRTKLKCRFRVGPSQKGIQNEQDRMKNVTTSLVAKIRNHYANTYRLNLQAKAKVTR